MFNFFLLAAFVASSTVYSHPVDGTDTQLIRATVNVGRQVVSPSVCSGGTPEPTGPGLVSSPDFASDFAPRFYTWIVREPTGFSTVFTTFDAATEGEGYITYTSLPTYDVNLCAAKCNAVSGCVFFNIYYERDPSVTPGTGKGCLNPPSTTNIKCSLWSVRHLENPSNRGQRRVNFEVVIGGSNGYVKSVPDAGTAPAKFAIMATGSGTDADGQYYRFGGPGPICSGVERIDYGQFNADIAAATLFNLSTTANIVALSGPAAGNMAYAYRDNTRNAVVFDVVRGSPYQALTCYVSTSNVLKCNTDYTNEFSVTAPGASSCRQLYTSVNDGNAADVDFPRVTLIVVAV